MQSHSFLCYFGSWKPVLCEVNDAQNYLQTEGINIHQCAQKILALQIVLEAKREESVDDALIYAKSLCEQLQISFESRRRIRRKPVAPEVILSMDELNLDLAPQNINKEEFQLERVRLQACVAATALAVKKNSLGPTLRVY
ncbi:UNVERIFIED_CONTAM: hypothetical protein NCL1_57642 [Trichonephila clavipes]